MLPKVSDNDMRVAKDYILNRRSTTNGLNMPESVEGFLERTGQHIDGDVDYVMDAALVDYYPGSFERNYLEKKYGR